MTKREHRFPTNVTPGMPGVGTYPSVGSHLPALMRAVELTTGPVLELGSGLYSTPYLHWVCFTQKRSLMTFETDPAWFDFARQFAAPHHVIATVDDLSTEDLSRPWSVAFVDFTQQAYRRYEAIQKLTHAEYVVAHDAENRADHHYRYSRIAPLFTSRYDFTEAGWPPTAVFSNHHDLRDFLTLKEANMPQVSKARIGCDGNRRLLVGAEPGRVSIEIILQTRGKWSHVATLVLPLPESQVLIDDLTKAKVEAALPVGRRSRRLAGVK